MMIENSTGQKAEKEKNQGQIVETVEVQHDCLDASDVPVKTTRVQIAQGSSTGMVLHVKDVVTSTRPAFALYL